MEENEVQEVETEVADEILDVFDTAFDDDDDSDISEEADETEGSHDESNEEQEQTADQSEEPAETSEEQGTETETGNQRFKIKYLGAEEEYDLGQFTELAQKGRNYDHVVEERDRLKGESGRHKAFLQKLADRAGVSIDEQIDLTEAMWLMDEEAEKGNSLTEAEALLRVQRNRNQPEPEPQQQQQNAVDNSAKLMIDRFLRVYPNIPASEIPKEVWDRVQITHDLLGEYQAYEIKKLKEENEKVKQDARNERNSQRSTGPRKTSGSTKTIDDFDAGWDSDD